MRRPFASLLLLVLSAAAVRAEDDIAQAVTGLVARLGDSDAATREAALTELIRIGVQAEPAVRDELKRATDPEIRGRLRDALRAYAVAGEEAWTIQQIRKDEPFPAAKAKDAQGASMEGTLANRVEWLTIVSGVKIEVFAEDEYLKREMEVEPVGMGSTAFDTSDVKAPLWRILSEGDFACVVDGERVVIVRLTPAVLFELLGRVPERGEYAWLERELTEFASAPHDSCDGVLWSLADKAQDGGQEREKWLAILRGRALDAAETPGIREAALLGLSTFVRGDEPQPDVDEISIKLTLDPEVPFVVREAAARVLVKGISLVAQDAILDLLGGKDSAIQQEFLDALMEWDLGFAHRGSRTDEKRLALFRKKVGELQESVEPGLRARATIFRALEGDAESSARLADLPEPTARRARLYFLQSLRQAGVPAANDRLFSFHKHADPEVRAAVARLIGDHAGGKDREAEVELVKSLLDDPAPIVRKFAVGALGVIFDPRAAERFDVGRGAMRDRLAKMLQEELDPRVMEAIRSAISEIEK